MSADPLFPCCNFSKQILALFLWDSLLSPHDRWFDNCKCSGTSYSLVTSLLKQTRHFILSIWTYGFLSISFWFHRISFFWPLVCDLYWWLLPVWHWWLAAPDSQLHKLIHPWSLASMGTYTLFFLFTLLIANIPVASDSFCFSSLAYHVVWPGEFEFQFHWDKEIFWRKLNTEGDRLETYTLIYSTTLVEPLIEARHFTSGICWSKTSALSPRNFQINGRARKTFPQIKHISKYTLRIRNGRII